MCASTTAAPGRRAANLNQLALIITTAARHLYLVLHEGEAVVGTLLQRERESTKVEHGVRYHDGAFLFW
jgi:hypothetical protein